MPYIYIPTTRIRKEIIYLILLFVLFIAAAVFLYTQYTFTPTEGVALFVAAVGGTVIIYALWVLLRYIVVKILNGMGYAGNSKEHKIHVIRRPSTNKKKESHHHHHHHHHHHSED